MPKRSFDRLFAPEFRFILSGQKFNWIEPITNINHLDKCEMWDNVRSKYGASALVIDFVVKIAKQNALFIFIRYSVSPKNVIYVKNKTSFSY
jgi:hypothetical protein